MGDTPQGSLEWQIAEIIRKHRNDPIPPQGYPHQSGDYVAAEEILKLLGINEVEY